MVIEIPGVDADSGLKFCEGDVNIYMRFLRLYVSSMSTALEKIRSVSEETLRDYAASIHGIKGISETIGAEEARKTAKQLEIMAKSNDLAGVLAQNKTFITYAENLVANIRSWLEKNNTSST
ncbi:MAG: Hpt domain-containing protein [Spirochaetaceae bacterium]|nr:Hpt domain-containing protein [Spirochaetaceae bacterium]